MSTVIHAGASYALDAVTGRATVTTRTVYAALLTAAPTRGTTTLANMAELTTPGSSGYSRLAVTFTTPSVDTTINTSLSISASAYSTKNSAQVLWSQFTADLGNITHVALVSASTGTAGDFIESWDFAAAKDPAINDGVAIAAGALILAL